MLLGNVFRDHCRKQKHDNFIALNHDHSKLPVFLDATAVIPRESGYLDKLFPRISRIVVCTNYSNLQQILHTIHFNDFIACARDVAKLQEFGFGGRMPHCLPNGDYDELQCVIRTCYCRSYPDVTYHPQNMTRLPCCKLSYLS